MFCVVVYCVLKENNDIRAPIPSVLFSDMGTITDHYAHGSRLTMPRLKEIVKDYQMIFHNGDVGYAM